MQEMSALRRKSIASGAGVADEEVSGGGVVAVPAAYSRFSDDDGGGDWKHVPGAAEVAGLRRFPPLLLTPLVMGTSNGGRDCRKRSPTTIGVCDADPTSWYTDSGGGCDGTATPICRCCCC